MTGYKGIIGADLTGRAVLVTGGGSGIGLATVRQFARLGARVAVNHLPDDPAALDAVDALRREGHDVRSAPADVGDPAEAEAMVRAAVDDLGRLDWLVNNAGVSLIAEPIPFSDLDAIDADFWHRMMSVNLYAAFFCTRGAATALRAGRGAVVNVSSSSHEGTRGTSIPYSASKGALVTMTRSLAQALAPEVRVNAVAPGFIEKTGMTADRSPEHRARVAEQCLLKRIGQADEVAETILYLCVASEFITGQIVRIDGGRGC